MYGKTCAKRGVSQRNHNKQDSPKILSVNRSLKKQAKTNILII